MSAGGVSRCCLCCVAAAERGELDHALDVSGFGCPYLPCNYHQPDELAAWELAAWELVEPVAARLDQPGEQDAR